MNILGIDTSSEVAAVAVINEEKLIAEYILNYKKTHSKNLMPMIDQLLKSCDMKMDDIDLIGVCTGPGSFTGLRIGVATAKAMAHVKDIPLVSVDTLSALAFNMSTSKGYIVPILDAQRGQVYSASYLWENGRLQMVREIRVEKLEELIDYIKTLEGIAIVLGEASNIYRESLELVQNVEIPPSSHRLPRASSICEIAKEKYEMGETTDHFNMSPLYIRKSQAEVQYEEKMKRKKANE